MSEHAFDSYSVYARFEESYSVGAVPDATVTEFFVCKVDGKVIDQRDCVVCTPPAV